MRIYYQGILEAAAAVDINAPEVLLSVLWHAPRGNARQYPEGLGDLEKMVAAAQVQPNQATYPENVHGKLILDNARYQTRESAAGSPEAVPDQPGPQPFLKKRRDQPVQPGGAVRTPFSCRKIRGN
jgi:hypothetical protein